MHGMDWVYVRGDSFDTIGCWMLDFGGFATAERGDWARRNGIAGEMGRHGGGSGGGREKGAGGDGPDPARPEQIFRIFTCLCR